MKIIYRSFWLLCLSTICGAFSPPHGADEKSEYYARLEAGVVAMASKPHGEERISRLGEYLRKFGRRLYQVPDPEWTKIFEISRSALLATPGHARYFAEEIERLIADPANMYTDVRQRRWFIEETLVHLPSPETIWVLGNYLTDERYAPIQGRDNSGGTLQNSYLATTALRRIGLRESEGFIRTTGNRITTREDLQNCLRWWDEVKSGERTFSFKGQAVTYRFNGDGTWVTSPSADSGHLGRDGEGVTPGRIEKRTPPELLEDSAGSVGARHWGWFVACLVVVTFAVWRLLRLAGGWKCSDVNSRNRR